MLTFSSICSQNRYSKSTEVGLAENRMFHQLRKDISFNLIMFSAQFEGIWINSTRTLSRKQLFADGIEHYTYTTTKTTTGIKQKVICRRVRNFNFLTTVPYKQLPVDGNACGIRVLSTSSHASVTRRAGKAMIVEIYIKRPAEVIGGNWTLRQIGSDLHLNKQRYEVETNTKFKHKLRILHLDPQFPQSLNRRLAQLLIQFRGQRKALSTISIPVTTKPATITPV
jgi:hypothetical protein